MSGSDVIVIGAGIAGAVAATVLAKSGLDVAIIEARDRVGGRGYARNFADTEDVLDFGGAWITPWQERMRRLCREHWMDLRSRVPVGERRFFRDGGLQREVTSAADRPAHERAIARIAADAILLKMGHAQDERGRDIAQVSFADYLDRVSPPPATRELLSAWWCQSGNGDKTQVPAAELLASSAYGDGLTEAMADVWADTIVGGVSELVTRMIVTSGAKLVTSRPVSAIVTSKDGVSVSASGDEPFTAKAAIVATGINPLRNIAFEPALPAAKAAAIGVGHLGRAVKVWAKVTGVPDGIMVSGGGSGIEWMFSERETSDGATMLVGFGVAANGWEPDLPKDIEQAVARFFPEAKIVATDWHDWNDDPYSLGAWVAAKVGAEEATAAATWTREGPLAFASSDFAAEQAGWFEGAAISGEAAAQEILAFLGKD
ncbi:MAG TPA: NAD(P)/FAD-dependent oxidoreductase [Dongiaceae bacterium]|nr:NAD(P)/FAD-dependent oxidoreductase [Dongiaceae bacterium]